MPKSFLLLVMAAGCGLAAMLVLKQFMSDGKPDEQRAIKVLVAKTDIKPKVPLGADLVEFQERPADQVPIGAVQTFEQYDRRALRTAAVKGEVILTSKLGEQGDYDASSEIPPGYRVVTVPITATTSHSGQIRPHDRVDIYVTYQAKDDPADRIAIMKTKLILDYIEVFAMGADRYSDATADDQILAKNASLLVTPTQASILMMAENKGEIRLALRPKDDKESATVDPLNEKDFDHIGTDYSMRDELEQQHKEEIDSLKAELTNAHEEELADLTQKTSEEIARTIADYEKKYIDEQSRRDKLHAETLASLEAKNTELQLLLQKAIDESTDKESLAASLNKFKTENQELQKLLADAKARAAAQVPTVIPEPVFEPKTWTIKILSGRKEVESEFLLNPEESGKPSDGKKPTESGAVEEETSTKYSPKNGNTAPVSTKRSR